MSRDILVVISYVSHVLMFHQLFYFLQSKVLPVKRRKLTANHATTLALKIQHRLCVGLGHYFGGAAGLLGVSECEPEGVGCLSCALLDVQHISLDHHLERVVLATLGEHDLRVEGQECADGDGFPERDLVQSQEGGSVLDEDRSVTERQLICKTHKITTKNLIHSLNVSNQSRAV